MKKIDEKVKKVYEFTVAYIDDNGFPPSVRDICNKLNIKSTATAYSYLQKLKTMGLVENKPNKKRAISISNRATKMVKSVPLVGIITAGSPVLAVENLEGYYTLPEEFDTGGDEFALKVKGESMINAGIYDGDVIIVKQQNTAENGEIIVALIEDSATVKRFYKKDNKIILHPENDNMSDMVFDDVQVLGVVKGLMRKF
jgi:repressor LexA